MMVLCAGEIFLLMISLFINGFMSADIPIVVAKLGTITGETKSVIFQEDEFEVDRYLGIPYAKPPTGELRFKRPEPYGQFSEPITATDFGPACPQKDFLKLEPDEETSEDCLFLNIFVPRQKSDEKSGHAVMFFIHGGGFMIGSGKIYEGDVLSSIGNVIVVTFNYRLGLLGFLDIDNEKSQGNFGLWDQRLALEWVKDNIDAFGGDTERVTIFGESAGSISVALHMIFPPNKGLFRSGITQSGALTMPGFYKENNIHVAQYFAEKEGCSIKDLNEVFNCLQSASHENIIRIYSETMESGDMAALEKVETGPTIDETFIKTNPAELLRSYNSQDCEEINFFRSLGLMNGVNGKEGSLFLLMFEGPDTFEDFEISREQMNSEQIPAAMPIVYGSQTVPEAVKQLLISEYTDWKNPDDPKTLRDQLLRLYGDIYFNIPAIEMSRVHSNASNVDSYVYNFVAFLDKHLAPIPKWVNEANHADEIGPVFGYNFDFKLLLNISNYSPPDWELDLSRRMMTFWTNFAKTGNPNLPSTEKVSSIVWPKYDIVSQSYIKFDQKDSTGQYLHAKETDFWKKILPAVFDAIGHAQTSSLHHTRNDDQTCDKDDTCE